MRYNTIAKLLGSAWLLLAAFPSPSNAEPCRRCNWSHPETEATLTVGSLAELREVLGRARPGTTILLDDGVYLLDRMLDLPVPDLVLRGKSGDRSRVVFRGQGMEERQVGVALSVSAPRVTLADLSVGAVGYHGVQVRGEQGADSVVLHNLRVVDTGQQLLKGSMSEDGRGPHEGLVACSVFEYSNHAPSDYTNGVDVLGGRGWVVRDTLFRRIRGPQAGGWASGPAVLFWKQSAETTVERNIVVDCYRGIALGLEAGQGGSASFDHRGGLIRNNAVCNLHPWADEGIEANGAPGVRIEHNTVLVEGKMPWSISVRFSGTDAWVRNNLTNRPIVARDGARLKQEANINNARPDWFDDPGQGSLRLSRGDLPAIDAGIPITEIHQDLDLRPRVIGNGPDAGAFEFDEPRE
jgi:hypothetical protein